MYKVLERFMDGQDPERHVYTAGDLYPREGYEPDADRIAELSGSSNSFGCPLIAGGTKPKRTTRRKADA